MEIILVLRQRQNLSILAKSNLLFDPRYMSPPVFRIGIKSGEMDKNPDPCRQPPVAPLILLQIGSTAGQ